MPEAWRAIYEDSDSDTAPAAAAPPSAPAKAQASALPALPAVVALRKRSEAKSATRSPPAVSALPRPSEPKVPSPKERSRSPPRRPDHARGALGLLEPDSSDSGDEAAKSHVQKEPLVSGAPSVPARETEEPRIDVMPKVIGASRPQAVDLEAQREIISPPEDVPVPKARLPPPAESAAAEVRDPSAAASSRPPRDGGRMVRSLRSFLGPDEGLAAKWSEGPLALRGGSELPEAIASRLRGYQRKGVSWLYERLFIENRGCLLTDEMGLGKTVQVACALAVGLFAAPKESGASGAISPALVLCPPTLVGNWARELRRWAPFEVEVLTPSCSCESRQRLVQRVAAGLIDVLVASRGLLSRPHESTNPGVMATEALLARRWGCVVIDEVHQAKNHKGQLHKAIVALNSPRKLGLTGTPLQNSLSDVWTLLRTVEAHEGWDIAAFESRFSRPIAKGQKRKATAKDLAVREDALKEFQELLARNCLRRTKDDVALMLPGKNDRVVPCPLSHIQQAAYRNLLASPDFQIALGKRELCICGAGRPCMCGSGPVWRYVHRRQAEAKGLEDEWAAADECVCRGRKSPKCISLSLIVILQRLCNHLEQLKPDPQPPKDSAEAEQQELMRELCEHAFRGIEHNLCTQRRVANRLQLGDPEACGKMQVLLPLLRHWRRRGQKVLVFSRSTRLLDILEACLWQQGWSPAVLRLDGSTAVAQRQRLVDEFNTSTTRAIFLISTRAGGVGLNLTAASVVVIFDPDWNPFSDLQAQDRSFRIGQTRVVEVYRLLGAGTIEEQVYVRQVWKQQLAAAAIDGTRSARRLDDQSFGLGSLFELHDSSMLPALMAEAFKNRNPHEESVEAGVQSSKTCAGHRAHIQRRSGDLVIATARKLSRKLVKTRRRPWRSSTACSIKSTMPRYFATTRRRISSWQTWTT